ncbi:hypothetical protein PB16LOC_03836 [Pectobacterium versatile]|nr:hypothetical protein PB16LOC_03836 [Pectobacterium versatile]
MSDLMRDLAPLMVKLIVTCLITNLTLSGHLNGGLLAPLIEGYGSGFLIAIEEWLMRRSLRKYYKNLSGYVIALCRIIPPRPSFR